MGAELDVDGPRPAVQWVTSLPRSWLTDRQRHVLQTLALDTYDRQPPFTCSPSRRQLAVWTGLWSDQLKAALDALAEPTAKRPALIEIDHGSGRQRDEYTLLCPGGPDHNSSLVDNSLVVGGPRSQQRRSDRASDRASDRVPPITPFPLPTTPLPVVPQPQDAREGTASARCASGYRVAVDGTCCDEHPATDELLADGAASRDAAFLDRQGHSKGGRRGAFTAKPTDGAGAS